MADHQKAQNVKPTKEAAHQRRTVEPVSQEWIGLQPVELTTLQRSVDNPGLARPADILNLQRAYGNRAITRLIQAKLTVGPVGDQYEQEADRVAEQVLTMPAPRRPEPVEGVSQQRSAVSAQSPLQRQAPEEEEEVQAKPLAAPITPLVQRQEEEEEEVQMMPLVQRRADGSFEAGSELESRLAAHQGSGSPLPNEVRAFMEPRFGADFSGVRVHTGGEAVQMTRELQAQAFTHGQGIYLGAGRYDPGSTAGKRLLAHELTHTIQQTGQVQRLPTAALVKGAVGFPKQKAGKSERYKAFLSRLDAYDHTIMPFVAPQAVAIRAQVLQIHAALDNVIAAAAEYNRVHHTDRRARHLAAIGEQARLEKSVISTRAQYFINNPTAPRLSWSQVIPKEMGTHTIDMSKGTQVATQAGGINVVGSYVFPPGQAGYTGFFKEEKDEITNKTEADIAGDLGIPFEKPRFSERALAMYRVDQLLGANMLTRTDRAFRRKGVVKKSKIPGVISATAPGEGFGKMGNAGRVVKTTAQKTGAPADTISLDDPVLQRSLSKLNLLDALCYQVDRHTGNFYVKTDGHGNVVSVAGIDNDLAFPPDPQYRDIGKRYQEYRGITFYVDAEMAEMIMALAEDDLRAVLAGLLADGEIDNTIARLQSLKARLSTAKAAGRLLSPDKWNAMTAAKESEGVEGYINEFRYQAL
jgi:hypothetical protein